MKIHLAQARHLDSLTVLFDAYRIFYRQESDPNAARQFLDHLISNKSATIFLALSDAGTCMGFTTLYPSYTSVGMAPIYVLNDLFVHPDYRLHHVGESLMHHAAEWAKSIGAVRLQLETEKSNHSAQNLYKKLGYKLESDFLHFALDLRD